MIAWVKTHPRSAAICGATLLLPVLFYLNLLFGAWGLRAEYAADVDRLVPRIARMQGIVLVEEQLRESSAVGQQQNARLVYPSSAEPAAPTRRIRASAACAGRAPAPGREWPARAASRWRKEIRGQRACSGGHGTEPA